MDNLNFEFAKIIANNYTTEEQPMWDASSAELQMNDNDDEEYFYNTDEVIDIMTLAFIPNVGRIDVVIVKDDGGFLGRFNKNTNRAEFESTSYGEGTELDNLQGNAEMFVDNALQDALVQQNIDPEPVVNAQNIVQDITRSTDRQGESLAANQLQDKGMGVMEANMILRAMYRVLPSKDILALMDEDIFPG